MEEVAHCWWWLVDGGWWMLDGSGSLRAAGYQTQKRVTEWANPGMGLGPLDGLRCMGNWNKWLNGSQQNLAHHLLHLTRRLSRMAMGWSEWPIPNVAAFLSTAYKSFWLLFLREFHRSVIILFRYMYICIYTEIFFSISFQLRTNWTFLDFLFFFALVANQCNLITSRGN